MKAFGKFHTQINSEGNSEGSGSDIDPIQEKRNSAERKYLGKLIDTTVIAKNVEAVKDAASRPLVSDEVKKLEYDSKLSGIMDATKLLNKIEEVKKLAAAATPTPAQQAAAAAPRADKVLSSLLDPTKLNVSVKSAQESAGA